VAAIRTSTTQKPAMSNNNLVIVMVLITFLVIGAGGIITKILISSILLDSKVVAAKQKADKQLDEDKKNAPDLVNAYRDLGDQAGKLDDALPTTADFPALIVELENVSRAAGIALKSVNPAVASGSAVTTGVPTSTGGSGSSGSGSVNTPSPQPYSFSINFTGNYDSAIRLMARLETSARPMTVTGWQFSGSGQSLTGEIEVTTYYQDKATLPFSTETIK
jgi:hypothetical protein